MPGKDHIMERKTIRTHPPSRRCVLAGPTVLGILLGWLVGLDLLRADEDAGPDAAAILDRYVEVTGGRAAYERFHNYVAKGRLVFVDMGFEGTFAYYHAEPNKLYMHIESDVVGQVERGTNGDVVWYLAENTGARIEEGEQRAVSLRDAAFNGELHWRKHYQRAQYAGEEVVDDKTCHRIVMTPNEDPSETRYFDRESNLLVKISRSGPRPVATTFTDYRWVDGLLIPHRKDQVYEQCGGTLEVAFVTESLEHNVDLSPKRFDPPMQVQASALARKAADFIDRAVHGDGPRKAKRSKGGCGSSSSSETRSSCGKSAETASQQKSESPKTGGCGGGGGS